MTAVFGFLLPIFSAPLNADHKFQTDYIRVEARVMTLDNSLYIIKTDLRVFNDQDGMEMRADAGVFDTLTEILRAEGKVKMKKEESRLSCGQMIYYSRELRALMRENPLLIQVQNRQIKDPEKGGTKTFKTKIAVVADEIEYFQNEDRILAKGKVKILEVPHYIEDEEILRPKVEFINKVSCESLELYLAEDRSINRGHVEIITPDLQAKGDKATYNNREKRLEIEGHAEAFQTEKYRIPDPSERNLVKGDRILYCPADQRTLVVGNVKATVFQQEGDSKKGGSKTPKGN